MTSYPDSGGRQEGAGGGVDDFGRYASSEELPSDDGGWPLSTEELGRSDEQVGGSATTTASAGSTEASTVGAKKDAAKAEAADVKDTAVSAGSEVAFTAKQEAGKVAQEVGHQARGLLDQLRSEARDQGSGQKDWIASTLHSLSTELGSMASRSEQSGPVTDLAYQASRKGGEIAHWLENHEPGDVLEEVKRYARRRPVAFLAMCAAAGIVAGRLTRGAVAANTNLDSPDSPRRALPAGATDRTPDYTPAVPYSASAGTYATSADPYRAGTTGAVAGSTGMLNGPGDGYDTSESVPLRDDPAPGVGEYRR